MVSQSPLVSQLLQQPTSDIGNIFERFLDPTINTFTGAGLADLGPDRPEFRSRNELGQPLDNFGNVIGPGHPQHGSTPDTFGSSAHLTPTSPLAGGGAPQNIPPPFQRGRSIPTVSQAPSSPPFNPPTNFPSLISSRPPGQGMGGGFGQGGGQNQFIIQILEMLLQRLKGGGGFGRQL